MKIDVPEGFRLAGVHCGIKQDPQKEDLTLVVCDRDATAAGVYTQNLVFAAPVALDRARTPMAQARVVVVNSGNANACTGERGLEDAHSMARLAAESCAARPEQALVMSTGIIGEYLPMDRVAQGIAAASSRLARDEAAFLSAARGIMTTDKFPKVASRSVTLGERTYGLAGMAKGAGMIGPNMATMLGLVLSDAPLAPADAQTILRAAAERSFNCISVEGHTSTNDTLLLLAAGRPGETPLAGADLAAFGEQLAGLCVELARQIPSDGEGASHLIEIQVLGCATRAGARRIAKSVAESALVKTAIAGADPNWGRIVSAAGYAGVGFDPRQVTLHLNGFLLYRQGERAEFDPAAVSASLCASRDTQIRLEFGEGQAGITFWTSDLTHEYIRINADYHT